MSLLKQDTKTNRWLLRLFSNRVKLSKVSTLLRTILHWRVAWSILVQNQFKINTKTWRPKSLWSLGLWLLIRHLARTRVSRVSLTANFFNTSFRMSSSMGRHKRIMDHHWTLQQLKMSDKSWKKNTLIWISRHKSQVSKSRMRQTKKSLMTRRLPSWTSQSVLTLTESTMPRTCVLHATERTEEDNSLGPANILRDWTTPWACVRLATWLTTTREETRPRRRKRNKPRTASRVPSMQSHQSPSPSSMPKSMMIFWTNEFGKLIKMSKEKMKPKSLIFEHDYTV